MKRRLTTAFTLLLAASPFVASSANAATVDLTAPSSSAVVNGATIEQKIYQPTGTGVFDAFVRMQANGQNTIEQGYNTDGRPLVFDEINSPPHEHSLLKSSLLEDNGSYVFALDVNEPGQSGKDTLDMLSFQVFLGTAPDLLKTNPMDLGALVYDMDGNGDITVNMKDLGNGSGKSDYVVSIPKALFAGPNSYVYLYSKFDTLNGHGGFEEWNALILDDNGGGGGGNPVPLPPAAWSGIAMVAAVAIGKARRSFKSVIA